MPVANGLYYSAHGETLQNKPPVLLLHGAGGTHLNWPPQVRRLDSQRIFAIDLPGHGNSEGAGYRDILQYARAVTKFMQTIHLSAAVVVGHSMGSAIALTMALQFPGRVLGLGLLGSGAKLRVAKSILELAAKPEAFPILIQMLGDLSYGPHTPPRLKELGAQRLAETHPSVLYGDFLACDAFDVMQKVHDIQVPTLLLCGSEDQMTPPNRSEYLHSQIEGSRLHILPGVGHMLMLEAPNETARLLGEFLNEILVPEFQAK
ncbi:MAG: alpha/beta hydrolase [Anaerolineales bacterium]